MKHDTRNLADSEEEAMKKVSINVFIFVRMMHDKNDEILCMNRFYASIS